MITQLNTLYVLSQGTWLSKEGECIEVRNEAGKKRLPIHMIGGGIVTFGNVMITPFLMGHCAAHGIRITCLTEQGRFLAAIGRGTGGNVFLRRRQYRLSDTPESAAPAARNFLIGKLANTRTLLRRAARERTPPDAVSTLTEAAKQISAALDRLTRGDFTLDAMRGLEGDAAARYFAVFRHMLEPAGLPFEGRERRPPKDPVNALLSFLYTLLAHDCASAAESVGLDTQMGFLHRDRSGRASLALDLMEELRPIFADRLALALLNRKQLKASDFESEPTGMVRLAPDARKTVLTAWQERKKTEIVHPYTKDKIPSGLIPFVQARFFSSYLRGDLDGYPPFIWR